MDDLKKKNAPEALQAILGKLKNLSPDEATFASSKIFGRSGAQDAMQLARSGEAVGAAMNNAAEGAKNYSRNAQAFATIERSLAKLKNSGNGFWLGIAEGAAPAVQMITNALNKIDITGIGQKIGKVMTGAFELFKEGKLSEFIGRSVLLGLEGAVKIAPKIMARIGVSIIEGMAQVGGQVVAIFQYAFEKLRELWTNMPWVSGPVIKGRSFKEISQENLNNVKNSGVISGAKEDANAAISDAWKNISKEGAGIWSELMGAADRAPKNKESGEEGATQSLAIGADAKAGKQKIDASALEKIGFALGSGGTTDHARNTAENTKRTNTLLEKTNTLLKTLGGSEKDFSNLA